MMPSTIIQHTSETAQSFASPKESSKQSQTDPNNKSNTPSNTSASFSSKIPGTTFLSGLKSQLKSPSIQLRPIASSATVSDSTRIPSNSKPAAPTQSSIPIVSLISSPNTVANSSLNKLKTSILSNPNGTATKKHTNLPVALVKPKHSANLTCSYQIPFNSNSSSTTSSTSNIPNSSYSTVNRFNSKLVDSTENSQSAVSNSSFIFSVDNRAASTTIFASKYTKRTSQHAKELADDEETRPTSLDLFGNQLSIDSQNNLNDAFNCELDNIEAESSANLIDENFDDDLQSFFVNTTSDKREELQQQKGSVVIECFVCFLFFLFFFCPRGRQFLKDISEHSLLLSCIQISYRFLFFSTLFIVAFYESLSFFVNVCLLIKRKRRIRVSFFK